MSTLAPTPSPLPAEVPLPASVLPNGGSRDLAEDVFQSAEQAVLTQAIPVAGDAAPSSRADRSIRRTPGSRASMSAIRSHVAANPCRSALLAAAAGALVAAVVRRQVRGR
jgi:hypothetical protein